MSETATPELLVEQRGAVLWLAIQREERRNALSHGVLAAIGQALAKAQDDRALRAIVITGAGDKAFCAGADLQAARVNGACMAGGMGLLAMCDMAVAATHAVFDWLLQRLLDKSPAAIRRGLYTMKRIESMGFEESMAFTESQIALFTLTEDAKEGQQAFQQKRKPQWKGR